MKQALKLLRRECPRLAARLALLAARGRVRFLPQSHREVRAGGPLLAAGGWVFSVSPSGRLDPVRREGGALYCPAFHEEAGESPTVGEELERVLGLARRDRIHTHAAR